MFSFSGTSIARGGQGHKNRSNLGLRYRYIKRERKKKKFVSSQCFGQPGHYNDIMET